MKRMFSLILALTLLMSVTAAVYSESAKFDPPVTVTAVRIIPNTATVSYPEGDSAENNVWTRRYLDEWGIDLQYLWMVPGETFDERTNLMIASSDLPDIFRATQLQFQQMYEAGLLVDQTEAYDKYATEYTKSVILESGPGQFNASLRDGKLMALPWTGLPREGFSYISVRADWEKELGLNGINTWDDLVAYMTAFKGMADGNYGYTAYTGPTSLGYIYPLFNAFDSYPELWVEKDGKLVYGGIQPEARDALVAIQKLYTDGLLDPEFGTNDLSKTVELLTSGKVGLYMISFSGPLYPWQGLKNNFPETEISFYPIPKVGGGPATVGHELGLFGYWVVTKGCEYPEAATMMMNTWMDIFYANTSDAVYKEMVNWDDGNEVWQNAFVQAYRGFKNLDGYYNNNAVLNGTMTTAELTPEERGVNEKIMLALGGDTANWAWDRIYGIGGSLSIVDMYKTQDLYLQNAFTGNPTPTMTDFWAILTKMQLETYTNIIQGADISEFDAFVDQWMAVAGADITDEVNEWAAAR